MGGGSLKLYPIPLSVAPNPDGAKMAWRRQQRNRSHGLRF